MVDLRIDGDLRNPDSINLLDHDIRLRTMSSGSAATIELVFQGRGSSTIANNNFAPNIFDGWTSHADNDSGSRYWRTDLVNDLGLMDTTTGEFTSDGDYYYLVQWCAHVNSTTAQVTAYLWSYVNRGAGTGLEDTRNFFVGQLNPSPPSFNRPLGLFHSFVIPMRVNDVMEFSIEAGSTDNDETYLHVSIFRIAAYV